MVDISKYALLPTIAAIYDNYVSSAKSSHRLHLGGSQIGHNCNRYLWYLFYWCESQQFDGRMYRLFDHGNWEEKRINNDLRSIGINVLDIDSSTGKQWEFSAFGGHFGLSLDGVANGFKESSAWHSLEYKTFNDKTFNELKNKGVEEYKPQHYSQIQIGLELADLDRNYYIAVNKNTDEMHGERIKRKHKEGTALLKKAERIIFSDEPLDKLSERPDWYECKWCGFYDICHQGKVAEVNCRTCINSTTERNGTWTCAKTKKVINEETQRTGCDFHLFRPSLVGYAEPIDAGDEWILYQSDAGTFKNGQHGEYSYTSKEIRSAEILPLEKEAEKIRISFGGEVE